MTLPAGTRLGHYELVSAIGAGGMGEVFKARDTHLNREVAVKVLPVSFSGDIERLARFKREAQVLASLNHPNVAQIYGFDGATIADGSTAHFLAMELVDGEDLAARLQRGPIPVAETVAIAKQIAEGLEEAHERGIIHRDLKPANLKVTPEGRVKILDFGLAKALEGDPSSSGANSQLSHSPTLSRHMTEAGMIMGTAAYMSPEQARGKSVDKRADIWSFGVVLYEMLTGDRLFAGETVSDVLASVLKGDLNFSALPTSAPPRLRNLIRDCLVRDPKLRLRDIGDARLALERALAAPSTREAARPARGRSGAALLAAVGLVALGAGLGIGRATVAKAPVPSFTARTFVPQIIFNARFMPDGKTVILSSALEGNVPSLFELRPDSPVPRPFGPPRTHLLSVSKSGEFAVLTNARFMAHRLVRGTLARMTLDSAPRAIAEDVREADWLPDGSDLVVIRHSGGRDQLEFPVGHVVHQSSGYLSDPRVSRDGARVAFFEHSTRFDNRGMLKVADRAGRVVPLSGDFWAMEGASWSSDGRSLLFSASTRNALDVFEVDGGGGKPPVTKLGSAGDLIVLDIAPDGAMVASREIEHMGVVVKGAGQGAERELGPFDQSWNLNVSHDGAFATFSDGRGGKDYAVTLRRLDGSPPVTLGEGNAGYLSHDGRWVTAAILSAGRCLVYPTGAGAPVPIPMGPLDACDIAFFLRDDKNLVIWGNEKGKAPRAYRAAFPGGIPKPLLAEGLFLQYVSESGDRFLVLDKDDAFKVVDASGALSPVKGLRSNDDVIDWSAQGHWAMVHELSTVPAVLERVALDTGIRTRVAELGPTDRAGVTFVDPRAYRENGKIYGYQYSRRVSTLFLVR